MALNRRNFLLTLPLLAGAAACSSGASHSLVHSSSGGRLASIPAPGKPTVLVCMPDTKQTREVWAGLKDELEGRFNLVAIQVDGEASDPVLRQAMREHAPA